MGCGVGWPDPTSHELWDLGGLPKVSEPQAPHLRNWGTVRSVVTIQCTLTYNHSAQHLALGPLRRATMSLARWPQCYRGWRARSACVPAPIFSCRWLFSPMISKVSRNFTFCSRYSTRQTIDGQIVDTLVSTTGGSGPRGRGRSVGSFPGLQRSFPTAALPLLLGPTSGRYSVGTGEGRGPPGWQPLVTVPSLCPALTQPHMYRPCPWAHHFAELVFRF